MLEHQWKVSDTSGCLYDSGERYQWGAGSVTYSGSLRNINTGLWWPARRLSGNTTTNSTSMLLQRVRLNAISEWQFRILRYDKIPAFVSKHVLYGHQSTFSYGIGSNDCLQHFLTWTQSYCRYRIFISYFQSF